MPLKAILFSASILASSASIALSQDQGTRFSAHSMFEESLPHLDSDGESLSLSNDQDFLEDCCKVADRILSPFMKGDVSHFRILEVVKALGLDGIKTLCSSSKHYGNFHIHKSFIKTSQLDRGLFGLLGAPTEKYSAHLIAPEDSDFLLETKLSCGSFYTTLMSLMKTVNRPVYLQLEKNMQMKMPEFDMNIKELLGKIDTRVAVMAKASVDVKAVSFEATLRAENVAKLLWPGLKPEFKKYRMLESKGNLHRYLIPKAIPGPSGMMDIYFLIDLDSDLLWISTSKDHLASCRNKMAKKLTSNTKYNLAMAKLPQTGSTQLYISSQLTQDFVKATAQSLNFDGKRIEPSASMSDMLFETLPVFQKGQGIAMVAQKHKSGMLFVLNSPCRIRFNIVAHWLFNAAKIQLFGIK